MAPKKVCKVYEVDLHILLFYFVFLVILVLMWMFVFGEGTKHPEWASVVVQSMSIVIAYFFGAKTRDILKQLKAPSHQTK